MSRRRKGLIKYAGKTITAAHALKCAAKGFKGCSRAETAAIGRVLARMLRARK